MMESDWYDLRRWVIRHGLSSAAITPTAQDTADIGNDIIPTSLRFSATDYTHLNAAGRQAEARQISAVTTARGWFQS
ncbi:hypothetical protein ACF044_05005 [Microbacterium sp. NPDC016588]